MDWLRSNSDLAPGGCATRPPNFFYTAVAQWIERDYAKVEVTSLIRGAKQRQAEGPSCQPYQTLFGARPMAGRETLNLEIVVRVHGAEPDLMVSRLMVGLRIPAEARSADRRTQCARRASAASPTR